MGRYEDFAADLAVTMWADYDATPDRAADREQPAIVDLSTTVVDGNFPWTIVEVKAADGTVGIGEAYPSPGVHEVITDYLRPVLVGEPPVDVDRLYQLMRGSLSGRGSQQGIGTIAISGVELALWDLTGKLLDQPVYQLLGGKVRDTVPMYADCHAGEAMVTDARAGQSVDSYRPEAYAQAARAAVDDGYDIVKFDLDVPSGHEAAGDSLTRHLAPPAVEHKRELVAAVTEAVGDDAEVAVDLHWNFGPEAAERICDAIAPYDLAWVEDPLPPENVDALARLNDRVDVHLLTGENRYGRHGFRDLLTTGACSFLAPDVPKTGGIAETKRIADAAATHYTTLVPHNIGSPVATAATVHLAAAVPNVLAVEYHAREVDWWEDLLDHEAPFIQNGRVTVPDGPGLGIDLDRSVLAAHER